MNREGWSNVRCLDDAVKILIDNDIKISSRVIVERFPGVHELYNYSDLRGRVFCYQFIHSSNHLNVATYIECLSSLSLQGIPPGSGRKYLLKVEETYDVSHIIEHAYKTVKMPEEFA